MNNTVQNTAGNKKNLNKESFIEASLVIVFVLIIVFSFLVLTGA